MKFIPILLVPAVLQAQGLDPQLALRSCRVEPAPEMAISLSLLGGCGGGMILFGWEGVGQNATTVFWHVEGTTADLGAGQRTALINALQAWADVVRITFRELPVANHDQSIDFNFLTGNHSAAESAEAGDEDCPFDGPGGTLAHAAFPPLVVGDCGGSISESHAGNVHFDDAETWEQDTGNGQALSLTLVACHEIGHALGLRHANGDCSNDVMRPTIGANQGFAGISVNDIENIRDGYASGTGSVVTLSETGVWVDGGFGGGEEGTEGHPFDSVTEGVNGVPPFTNDVTVHVQTGSYPETMTIQQAMIVRAENGSVLIGR